MSNSILISLICLAIIILIAVAILWRFYTVKNGVLRKIMIWYFLVEIYMYSGVAAYLLFWSFGISLLDIKLYVIILLLPKAIIKLRWLRYLKTQK